MKSLTTILALFLALGALFHGTFQEEWNARHVAAEASGISAKVQGETESIPSMDEMGKTVYLKIEEGGLVFHIPKEWSFWDRGFEKRYSVGDIYHNIALYTYDKKELPVEETSEEFFERVCEKLSQNYQIAYILPVFTINGINACYFYASAGAERVHNYEFVLYDADNAVVVLYLDQTAGTGSFSQPEEWKRLFLTVTKKDGDLEETEADKTITSTNGNEILPASALVP